jgi:2-polyprenyl-3-methyl-5-hydroxy-6-metoxy-1,4-benzoquinol methylase
MACLLCKSEVPMKLRFRKDGYSIQTCRECGLTQISPLPPLEVLERLYGEDYFSSEKEGHGYAGYADREEEYLATFAEEIRRISAFVPRGSVLDVGCAHGYFVRAAIEAGYDAYGVDVSKSAVEAARRRVGDRVYEGRVETAKQLHGRRFDVIYCSQLIEHVWDPVPFVCCLRDHLNEGGILVLVTPNTRSFLSLVSGRRWISFRVPEHVAYYNPHTIARLYRECACTMLRIETANQYSRVPFVAGEIRKLIRPLDRLIPHLEHTRWLRNRMIRVTIGSLRAIGARADGTGEGTTSVGSRRSGTAGVDM